MEKLTENEIRKRMTEWRNLKVLHRKAVEKNIKLKADNRALRKRVAELEQGQIFLLDKIGEMQLQIEELKQMVFGRKRKKKEGNDNDDDLPPEPETGKPEKRGRDSYKRPVPDEKDVTSHEYHNLGPSCPDCGTSLRDKETVVFYEEDIPLPDERTKLKRVTLHRAEQGYCPACRKRKTACPLPSAVVILGEKVRLYIVYLSILMRLSFFQIRSLLWDTYHFRISEGEIAKILHRKADGLRPEFERIKKGLRESRGVHLDETGWNRGLYLWVMASMDTEDVLYRAGKSRGKGNADDLLGKDFKGVRVTDAYAAYRNQPGLHQQCWSHPHTKLRQLAYTETVSEGIRDHCLKAYGEFSEMYEKLRGYLKEDFDPVLRADQKKGLALAMEEWGRPRAGDPKKLRSIRAQFQDYPGEWLTCMDEEGIPCDNNKAERKLRHFVIKRKISFGNKSKKGHETFEILASVLMTYWKTYKDSFFAELSALCLKGV